MKVLMLNGSSKLSGNTYLALRAIGQELENQGIEYEIFSLGEEPIRDCLGCGNCTSKGCMYTDDLVNDFIQKAKKCDGFVFGSPSYYAHPSGRILSFLDRVFYCASNVFRFKPAAAVSVSRREGNSSCFDVLNKYFGLSQMPVAGSTYWACAYGNRPGELFHDAEGIETLNNLAKNLAWLLKCIESGKKHKIPLPDTQKTEWTHFIR